MMSKINDVDVDVYGLFSGKNLRQVKLLIGYKFKALYQKIRNHFLVGNSTV